MIKSSEGDGAFAPVLRKIQRLVMLDPEERQSLLAAFDTPRPHVKATLFKGGAGENGVTVLLDGLAYSSRASAAGRAQVVAVHTPGDMLNLQAFLLAADHLETVALTSGRTSTISHGRLKRLIHDHSRLGLALWGVMATDVRLAQEWMFGLGQRSALQNMAHFICELQVRVEPAAARADLGFNFPLTQDQLGETLGLSVVHVNRTLQQLRGLGLIRVNRAMLTILNVEGLRTLAGFNGAYLYPAVSTLFTAHDGDGRDRFRDGEGERFTAA